MKIVMLCDFYNEKLEFQENLLTKYYSKHGHQVVVITSTYESVFDYYSGHHDRHSPPRIYNDGKAKVVKLKYRYNILNKLRAFTPILRILDEEKPDLIYVHDIIPNMLEAVRYVKKHPECKMIMDYHADYSNSGKNWLSLKILHGLIRKWFLDRARNYFCKIFPVVPAGIKFLHEVYGVPNEEMELLPLGADLDLGEQCKKSNDLISLRARYQVNPNTRVILTGGKLGPRKRTELLIAAFKDLDLEDTRLIVIGDSAEQDGAYLDMLVAEAAGHPDIYFTGWLGKEEVYRHLAVSDLAVFPASQSIIWQQAISMGLPLIVGNTGEQSIEYLNLYDNIVILDKDAIKVENLRFHINRILTEEGLYAIMNAGALAVARECLDWNSLIDRTLRFNNDERV